MKFKVVFIFFFRSISGSVMKSQVAQKKATEFVNKNHEGNFIVEGMEEDKNNSSYINIQVKGQGMDWKCINILGGKRGAMLHFFGSLDTFDSSTILTTLMPTVKEEASMA